MTRKRIAWITAASAVGLFAMLAIGSVFVVRSAWFRGQVRRRIVSAVETATGGRVEAGAFTYEWRRGRAQVSNFTIHGIEAAGKPPLFHAASIAVELRIVSLWRRRVIWEALEVKQPRVYLIVYPDGLTNIPGPKRSGGATRTIQSALDLAIGRFSVEDGVIDFESHGSAPFAATGRNLKASMGFDRSGPSYRGELAVEPLDLRIPGFARTAMNVALGFALERNRIRIESASLATGATRVQLSGAIENLASPKGAFQYQIRAAQGDVARFLRTKLLERGTVLSAGTVTWSGGEQFALRGRLNAYDLEYRDSSVLLSGFRADGAITAGFARHRRDKAKALRRLRASRRSEFQSIFRSMRQLSVHRTSNFRAWP